MTDESVLAWLMQMTTHIAALHAKIQRQPQSNAGPNFDDDSIPILDEPFAAWMGFRGPDAQDQATAWPPEELASERRTRTLSRNADLLRENQELWKFLRSLRDELQKRCAEQ